MLYVKIMSDEDLADNHQNKNFKLVPVANTDNMSFQENEDWDLGTPRLPRFALKVSSADGSHAIHALTGNAYVLSEAGKTIASHGC